MAGHPEIDAAARRAIEAELADPQRLVKAVASRPPGTADHGWRRAEVRPVLIRGRRLLQIDLAGTGASRTVNVEPDALAGELDRLFAIRFANWVVDTTTHTLTARALKRRTALHRAAHERREPALAHDRPHRRALDPSGAPFLAAVGIASRDGTVKAAMAAKLRQVDEFVRRVDDLVGGDPGGRLTIVDFGCGRAYLTFALYHHFAHARGLDVRLTGVDRDPNVIATSRRLAGELGWSEKVTFVDAAIDAYQPDVQPDLVVSLHACDTATDDALARAVGWDARWILAVPCCHHHLQSRMRHGEFPAAVRPLRQHGILFERLGDLLTDGFRATLLKLCSYDAEVHEFVEPEHTARNVMIRARKHAGPCPTSVRQAYDEMKAAWGLTPYLEHLVEGRAAQ